MKKTSLLLFTFLIFFCLSAQLRADFWMSTDGPFGGEVVDIVHSTGDQYIAVSRLYTYRSSDGGKTWGKPIPGILATTLYQLIKANSGYYIAGNNGLYKSSNGSSWSQEMSFKSFSVYEDPDGNIWAGCDNAVRVLESGDTEYQLYDNGIVGRSVYTILKYNTLIVIGTDNGIYTTQSIGSSWTKATGLPDEEVSEIIEAGSGRLIAATESGIYISSDGETWSASNSGFTGECESLLYDGTNIYAGSENGIYISSNNGDSWTISSLDNGYFNTLSFGDSGKLLAGTQNKGFYQSTDQGTTWDLVSSGFDAIKIHFLAIDDVNDYIYTATVNGLFISSDRGITWESRDEGIENDEILSVTVGNNGYVYVGTNFNGIFKSTDYGLTWEQYPGDLVTVDIYSMATAPGGDLFAGTKNWGVYQSPDDGETWTSLHNAFPDNSVLSLAVSNSEIVYAGTDGNGIWKRPVDGTQWTHMDAQPLSASLEIYCIGIANNGDLIAGTDLKPFKSNNGGDSWYEVQSPQSGFSGSLKTIAIGDNDMVFAASFPPAIFQSTDLGESWESMTTNISSKPIKSMVIDRKGYVYAGTETDGVWRSELPIYDVFFVDVTPTGKVEANRNTEVSYEITVLDKFDAGVENAEVKVTNPITGDQSVFTDADGKATYAFTVPEDQEFDNYTLIFEVIKSPYINSDKVFRFVEVVQQAIGIEGDTDVCIGTTTTYNATVATGRTHEWIISGGNILGDNELESVQIEWPTTGSATLTLNQNVTATNEDESKSIEITIHDLPTVTLDEFQVLYLDGGDFELIGGEPTGGEYSGDNVTDGYFDPKAAGEGSHLIIYTYTDPVTHCSASAQKYIQVNKEPQVSFVLSADMETICTNDGIIELKGGYPDPAVAGGTGTYSGPGIDNSPDFDPTKAGEGVHTIRYTYNNGLGFEDFAETDITVVAPADVTIDFDTDVCDNAGLLDLAATPSGGTFTGTGVVGDQFDPETAGVGGPYTITYYYRDGNECLVTETIGVTVHEAPVVTHEDSYDILCTNDAPIMLSKGSPTGPGQGEYSGTGVSGGEFNPLVAGPGEHTITYTYTDQVTGCSDFAEARITVLQAPTKPEIVQNGGELSLNNTYTNVKWYDEGDNEVGTNPTFEPQSDGNYYAIVDNGTQCQAQADIHYFSLGTIEVTLNIPDDKHAKPGDEVVLPLELEAFNQYLAQSKADTFSMTIRFNARMLEYLGSYPSIVVSEGVRLFREISVQIPIPANPTANFGLEEFRMRAMLGDDDSTIIEIKDPKITKNGVELLPDINISNGLFILDGICTEGGQRLVTYNPNALHLIYPNPSKGQCTIEYKLAADAYANLYITDMNGRTVHTFFNKPMQSGSDKLQFNTTQLPPGNYFIMLQTPYDQKSATLEVVR